MAKFKIIVSDPSTGKSQVVELEGSRTAPLIGRRLGEIVDGSLVGHGGSKLQITGGSDKDGFPMRPDIHGGVRASKIFSGGVGFHPKREGERQRKTVRGNIITEEIVQINMRATQKPQKKAGKTEKIEKAEKKQAKNTGKTEQEPSS